MGGYQISHVDLRAHFYSAIKMRIFKYRLDFNNKTTKRQNDVFTFIMCLLPVISAVAKVPSRRWANYITI